MRKITGFLLAMLLIVFGGFKQLHAVTCAEAQAIPAFTQFPWVSNLVCGDTDDIGEFNASLCGDARYRRGFEAVYVWTPGGDHANVSFAYSGQTRTGLFLYEGCPTDGGICIASFTNNSAAKTLAFVGNNQTSGTPISLTGGVTYYLVIDTWPVSTPTSPCPGTITINATPMYPCFGTPEPGNTLSSANPAPPTLDFSLSLENFTVGTGVTYQWQKSANGSDWDNAGPDAFIFVTSQTEATWYRCIVTCTNTAESDISTPVYVTVASGLSGNYTINQTAKSSKSNFGSFNEFAAAINLGGLVGPVTVDVVAGTGPYVEQVMFTELPYSSAVNTVTINGNGETLEFLSTNTNARHTLAFNRTDYVTVNDLVIKALGGSAAGQFGWAVWLANGADYISFYNCQFIALSTAGVTNTLAGLVANNSATSATFVGLAASNLTVENCTAIGGFYGMAINGSHEAPFSVNNTIVNNQIKDCTSYGLYLRGLTNSMIADNVITKPTKVATAAYFAIYITQNMSGTVIMNNQMYDFSPSAGNTGGNTGIYAQTVNATPGEELLIANNVIYGFQNANAQQYGILMNDVRNTKFYHNSISLDNVAHPGNHLIRGISHTGNPIDGIPSAIDIRNNIISVTSNSTGPKYCLYFDQTTANAPNLTSNHNVLHMGATAGTNNLVHWRGDGGTNYATLADWQLAGGGAYDQNSVDVDPIFVSPMLTPSNLTVNDIGQKLWDVYPVLVSDIFGTARSENPDPGAIEFGHPPQNIIVTGSLETCYNALENIEIINAYVEANALAEFKAGVSIVAEFFEVYSEGTADLKAGSVILLGEGVHIASGANFHAGIMTEISYCNIEPALVAAKTEATTPVDNLFNESSDELFTMYPNPTSGYFSIEVKQVDESSVILIEIIGMKGERVLHQQFNGQNKFLFDMSNQAKGVYFVRIIAGNQTSTKKLIKQ